MASVRGTISPESGKAVEPVAIVMTASAAARTVAAARIVVAAARIVAAEARIVAAARMVVAAAACTRTEARPWAASADSSAPVATDRTSSEAASNRAADAFPSQTNRPIRRDNLTRSSSPRHPADQEHSLRDSQQDCRDCTPVALRASSRFRTAIFDTHCCPGTLLSDLDAKVHHRLDEWN